MKPATRGPAGWFAVAAVAALLFSEGEARAETKQACVAAYEATQVLREAGKLIDARKKALSCTAPECPAAVVKECTQWLAQIDASMPTVVFEVRDTSGAETGAVQVSLDGTSWLAQLDGKAKPLDPGPHVLGFAIAGAEAREETVQIREGEKNRKLVVSFKKERPSIPPVTAPPAPTSAAAPPERSAAPWVIGGIGVAGLVVGAVLGGITLHDYQVTTDPSQCSATQKMCTPAGKSADDQGKVLGPATTVALVAGGVGVVTAGIWLGVRGREKKPATALSLTVGPTAGAAAIRLGGRW